MKISEGTIRNINNKILAGALVLTIMSTSLTGCVNNIKPTIDESSGIITSNVVDYSVIQNLKIVEVKKQEENLLFLAICIKVDNYYDDNTIYCYYNIFDEYSFTVLTKKIGNAPTDEDNIYNQCQIIAEYEFSDYLEYYGYNQKQISKEELQEIFKLIEKDYRNNKIKTLVKK